MSPKFTSAIVVRVVQSPLWMLLSPALSVRVRMLRDVLADWKPEEVQKVIAFSSWSWIGLMDDGCSVLKYPRSEGDEDALKILYEEAARYERVGAHENLVLFKYRHKHGLVLEYCANGSLGDVIQYHRPLLTDYQKTSIGQQVTRCLVHLHSRHLIHSDVSVRNVFLTADGIAKVGDLQGQLYSPDGTTIEYASFTNENAQSRHPHAAEDEFSSRTDIFALGTLLFCLWYGHLPFPELDELDDEDEIQARYRCGKFPLMLAEARGIDKIICKCWHSDYTQMVEVLGDMDDLVVERIESGSSRPDGASSLWMRICSKMKAECLRLLVCAE